MKITLLFCACISRVLAAPLPFIDNFLTIKNVLLVQGYNLVTEVGKISNLIYPDVGKLSNLIYPGTNFCGVGNVARRFDDLGDESQMDVCCRSHDFCNQFIEPKKNNFNLTNHGYFSSVHCDCDKAFNECLRSINTKHSSILGNIYFNVLGRSSRCFKLDYPTLGCKQYVMKYLSQRCVEYEYNTTKSKIYQWFDLPIYE